MIRRRQGRIYLSGIRVFRRFPLIVADLLVLPLFIEATQVFAGRIFDPGVKLGFGQKLG